MTALLYLGVDYSTKWVDLAGVTPDGDWCASRVQLPTQPRGSGGRGVRRAMREQLPHAFWDTVACCWVERPVFGNPATADALASVRGALLDAIPERVTVDTISPSVWRKHVGIPGNAKRDNAKRAAREWCHQHLPTGATSQLTDDQCEAACIAWTCLDQSTRAAAA